MNKLEYIEEIKSIVSNYRDKILVNILSSKHMRSKNISKEELYNLSVKLSLKYIIRLMIVKTWSEQNNIELSKYDIDEFVLCTKNDSDIGILNEIPVEPELSKDIFHIIYQLNDELNTYTIKPILHYVIGFLYEDSQNKDIRKLYGQFFTEKKYVDLILDRIPIDKDTKVLEPSVGGGSFISEVYSRLLFLDDDCIYKETYQGNLANNLYGLDIDEFCVTLSLINMAFQAHDVNNINYKIFNDDFLDYEFNMKFDVIIGNPPYNGKLDRKTKEKMKIQYPDITISDTESPGTFNTAALFVRKSIDLLNENGYLGFILPNSILRVHSYKKLRDFILENCTVKSLINIGRAFNDVGLEMVIVILQKAKPNLLDDVEVINITENKNSKINILKHSYFSRWDIFPLYLDNHLGKIADTITKNTVLLEDIGEMPRGTSISSKSEIFINNPFLEESEYIPVLRGQDIGRFYIKNSELFIRETTGIFDTKMNLFDQEKILVQNVAKRIVATYDNNNYVALDTINLLIIKDKYKDKYNYKYLLAIINSELMEFYFQNTINNRSKLTIHMDRPYLGKIPIKNTFNTNKIVNQVDKILELNENLNIYSPINILKMNYMTELELKETFNDFITARNDIENQILIEYNNLNDMIYQLYEIGKSDIFYIRNNLGVNPIRQFSFKTQVKSLITRYQHFINGDKIEFFESIL